ncbi:hypothetical protein DH2020_030399 [Rehmannia glutinosa]|uniref:Histidine decarboxylase n=1 Tax=Rehmannia glutinosa TaxID=99300 RepID=A0ABR0VPC5_REHGL
MTKISNAAAIDKKDYPNGNKKKDIFAIEEFCADRQDFLTKILTDFEDHLTEKAGHFLGYHVNLDLNHLMDLSPLLRFHINNAGDPFKDSSFISVLDWFGQLWEIEKDECWGYVTNGGTEGNFQGLLLGRELLADGKLYTSRESHYSVFKAARMFRMDCIIIRTLTTGEIDCNDLREKLCLNKDKPAIINLNIGTTFKGGVDNLDLVIKTLEECGFSNDRFYIHCDAALSGLISPFLEQLLSLNVKGRLGLQQDVKCFDECSILERSPKDAGIESMLNEMSFVVVFERPPNPEFIKYWNLSCEGNMTHVIAMPHVTVKMLEDFVNDFVQERNIWYQCGQIQPPCLAKEIGTSNCCCSIHGKGGLQNGN